MPSIADQDNWKLTSFSTGVIAFCVALTACARLAEQIWSNAPWNFDHILEVLLLGFVITNIPLSWLKVRKERVRILKAIASPKEDETGEDRQKNVAKSLTIIIGLTFSNVMLVTIAFLNLKKF